MAITVVIDDVETAITEAAATGFAVTSSALITADNFKVGENLIVYRLGPSGDYKPATNKKGTIVLSAIPNTAVIEGPAMYKFVKDVTSVGAYAGYEE